MRPTHQISSTARAPRPDFRAWKFQQRPRASHQNYHTLYIIPSDYKFEGPLGFRRPESNENRAYRSTCFCLLYPSKTWLPGASTFSPFSRWFRGVYSSQRASAKFELHEFANAVWKHEKCRESVRRYLFSGNSAAGRDAISSSRHAGVFECDFVRLICRRWEKKMREWCVRSRGISVSPGARSEE